MRIISPFRDYYDRHDHAEDDDVYIRKSKDIIKEDENKTHSHSRHGINIRLDKLIIGFCGEIYPLVKMLITGNDYGDPNNIKERLFYTREDFKKYDKHKDDDFIQYGDVYPDGGPASFFEKDFSSHKKEFIEHGVPCFVKKLQEYRSETTMFELNPKLIDYKFGRIKDAQTAYQDIDMYISGVLGNREVTVEIEDKYRVQAHGYNEESFRMPKGRKKPRRRNK